MIFIPIAFLIFLFFIFILPILFLFGYFHIIHLGFEKLGISSTTTTILLFFILLGSMINIPITKKRLIYTEQIQFLGLFQRPKIKIQGIAINLGGAIIPILISLYFLFFGWKLGFNLKMIFIATFLMTIFCKFLAKIVPGVGISLPIFIPPFFSSILALILIPEFAAPTAFIAGTIGTLIGADILNLKKIQKYGGFLSIGGAGVFDGIFLVGIVSALLTNI